VSTGGADFTRPRGAAQKVEGGYLVTGRKVFASQVPAGAVLATMFRFEDPDDGQIVLNMAVPTASDGVRIIENWDTLGMRGTASHDVELQDVFVADEQVLARRPFGVVDPPLMIIATIAMPIIAGVYLGVAEAARDEAVRLVVGTPRAESPAIQRQVGAIDTRLRIMSWALDGALAAAGDDPEPSVERLVAVMAAKREIATGGVEVCDLALEVAGGAGYFRTSPLERCYRDIRAAKYHPFTPEETLIHAGRVRLGVPADEM
jgi:alkylation response protein AidB-like acyl-CoA dehydrogenase